MRALRIHWNQAETTAGHHDTVPVPGRPEVDRDKALDQVFARIAAALPDLSARQESIQRGGRVEVASSDMILLFRWLNGR
ncbi:archease [Magnetospirillum gryphiswaldense]|uniref:Uncharacterized protein n=1 Tax=Magnetospirillum gryphiswaldense TaxID=55518 RepID=A4U1X5_9PROT|nr:hypothetical protein [Magnetospirillum gryphiswaldense]AVM73055.1 hypothetical protein MSR1_05430 [Magnetospirillum gryphiswaldense MSR-1]AVM76958.1 hypothetical protein MSR1L_05430 [Magnetospirillum gryphiswaldense]CAM76882.1 hypothetical protein MGR_0111 [Magnetospirillum gryphiswaldense MSR-1]